MQLIHPPLLITTELDSKLSALSGSTGHSCLPLAVVWVRSPLGCSYSRMSSLEVLGSPRKEPQPPKNIVALSVVAPLYGIAFYLHTVTSPGALFIQLHCGSMPQALRHLLLQWCSLNCRHSLVDPTLKKSFPGMCFISVHLRSLSTFFVLLNTWKWCLYHLMSV